MKTAYLTLKDMTLNDKNTSPDFAGSCRVEGLNQLSLVVMSHILLHEQLEIHQGWRRTHVLGFVFAIFYLSGRYEALFYLRFRLNEEFLKINPAILEKYVVFSSFVQSRLTINPVK